jgi:hypothetical protein
VNPPGEVAQLLDTWTARVPLALNTNFSSPPASAWTSGDVLTLLVDIPSMVAVILMVNPFNAFPVNNTQVFGSAALFGLSSHPNPSGIVAMKFEVPTGNVG